MSSDSLSAYIYDLPADRIAQHPAARRQDAKMMVLEGNGAGPIHTSVSELSGLLRGDELIVLNDVRVANARLYGQKETGGAVEALVLNSHDAEARDALIMARSSKPLREGQGLRLGGFDCSIKKVLGEGRFLIALPDDVTGVADFAQRGGELPLPPYIERPDGPSREDEDRYQTVFASHLGAVAAPTAGLHFTEDALETIRGLGCEVATVTLFVGPGTFQPVRSNDISEHRMHEEVYEIPEETVKAIARAKRDGRPVLAVGTTVVRALEGSAGQSGGSPTVGRDSTEVFIRPGYKFQVVDQLLTNFHLPGSTLLMLVSALAGRERILDAYDAAIRNGYRFFSYGDAMLIR